MEWCHYAKCLQDNELAIGGVYIETNYNIWISGWMIIIFAKYS